jgi:hypothetical protein
MIRRLLIAALFSVLPVTAAFAQSTKPQNIADVLHMSDLIAVMQEEGLTYGRDLKIELFPEAGGQRWDGIVSTIYDAERMKQSFDKVFFEELQQNAASMPDILAFFGTERGQRIVRLEIAARRKLLDTAAEEAAKVAVDNMRAERDPRLALLTEFANENDLIEQNVTGALNSNLAFYRGLSEGGAFSVNEMTEEEILADVWSQEPDIRAETEDWLFPFLSLAYGPLSDAEIQAYLEFSRTPAAKSLNNALFVAFDRMFDTISYDLGRAAADMLAGQDI